jgi:predicted nuclease of predicted toxin-antitoxin system
MKFILDAHLPASLALYFIGHDVLHTSALPEGNLTADRKINEISILEDRVLITKGFEPNASLLISHLLVTDSRRHTFMRHSLILQF